MSKNDFILLTKLARSVGFENLIFTFLVIEHFHLFYKNNVEFLPPFHIIPMVFFPIHPLRSQSGISNLREHLKHPTLQNRM